MTEDIDANTGKEAEGQDSSSEAVELQPLVDEEGLISTVEYEPVPKETEQAADTTTDPVDGATQKASDPTSNDKPADFNEHPRFKELIEQKNTLKAQNEKYERELAQANQGQQQQAPANKPEYENVLAWKDDDIIDRFTNDPKGFLKLFGQQIWHESQNQQQQISRQQQQQNTQQQAFNNQAAFFSEREDARAMLDDGRIKQYISENPGHNPVSAYYQIAGDSLYQGKIDKAVSEAKEQVYKELKAKGNAASFSSTPGGKTINPSSAPELKNPGKFGGVNAVLAKRMRERQAG